MKLTDLSENRERIIRKIKYQTSENGAIIGVMNKMVTWLEKRSDIQAMEPTMKNIDKCTSMCMNSWLKYDAALNIDQRWLDKREQAKRESISL